jgi:hypothetical protein
MSYKDMIYKPIKSIVNAFERMPNGTFVPYGDPDKICYAMTKKAYEKNEWKDLLLGNKTSDGDYRLYGPNFFQDAYAVKIVGAGFAYVEATEYFDLIERGLFPFYKDIKDEKIVEGVYKALEEIYEEGIPYDVFSATYFLHCFYFQLSPGHLEIPFMINTDILEKAKESIKRIEWPDDEDFLHQLEKFAFGIKENTGHDMELGFE